MCKEGHDKTMEYYLSDMYGILHDSDAINHVSGLVKRQQTITTEHEQAQAISIEFKIAIFKFRYIPSLPPQ